MAHERGRAVETIVDYWGQPITPEENSPVNPVNEEERGLTPTDQLTILARSLQHQPKSNGDTGRLRDFLTQT